MPANCANFIPSGDKCGSGFRRIACRRTSIVFMGVFSAASIRLTAALSRYSQCNSRLCRYDKDGDLDATEFRNGI